jgi:hypothetical protein
MWIKKERKIMNIPKDPIMLMSYINTQLRDNYSSLTEFAKSNDLDEEEIITKLGNVGYKYDPEENRFKEKYIQLKQVK